MRQRCYNCHLMHHLPKKCKTLNLSTQAQHPYSSWPSVLMPTSKFKGFTIKVVKKADEKVAERNSSKRSIAHDQKITEVDPSESQKG
mmetsp:Transcript_13762/g.27266  ORF Transcript_13762/g.27266 Transcript_13762/m.27266 type:complete len:87 (-) Transcript_13762:572-832(-)